MEQEIGQLSINGISCRICISPRRRRAGLTAGENGITLCGPACMTLADAEKIEIILGNLNAALYNPLASKLMNSETKKLPDEFIIHHITAVGIMGRQNRIMDFIISLRIPVNITYRQSFAVSVRKAIEQMSARITERR